MIKMKEKTLREIVERAIEMYDERDFLLYDIAGASRKFSVAGNPKMQESMKEYANNTLIPKSRSIGYAGYGEGIIPFVIDEKTVVYMNIAIKTNSPRVASNQFVEGSSLNKKGIVPIGMTILRTNEDGYYYFSQYDFSTAMAHGHTDQVEGLLASMKNNNVGDIINDINLMIAKYTYAMDVWYIIGRDYENNDKGFTVNLDEAVETFLSKCPRISNVLANKYIVSEYIRTENGYCTTIGRRQADNSRIIIPEKYENLYQLCKDNKAKRRIARTKNPRKGTVQEKINRYSELIDTLDTSAYTKPQVVIQRVPTDDVECVVVRFIGHERLYRQDVPMIEKYRIFVENSKLTYAEQINGHWSSTSKVLDSYELSKYDVQRLDAATLKGTKLEYLKSVIDEMRDISNNFDASYLVDILGINIFELIFADESLKKVFQAALQDYKDEKYFYRTSLKDAVRAAFGLSLIHI